MGATTATAGAGTWVSLSGWPAAVVVGAVAGAALLIVLVLAWLVLSSNERTGRVLQIIAALRYRGGK
jgi:hypothetical protein